MEDTTILHGEVFTKATTIEALHMAADIKEAYGFSSLKGTIVLPNLAFTNNVLMQCDRCV
jgi:hypothetical protein